jgi:hypothetical protein
MSLIEILKTDVPHPFKVRGLVTELNPEAFDRLEVCYEGEAAYEKLSWDENGEFIDVEVDVSGAVNLHSDSLNLYEDECSYIVVCRDQLMGYTYPKKDFTLIKKSRPSSELSEKTSHDN